VTKHYLDYFYKEGIPYGLNPLDDKSVSDNESYKIVMDPYRKRISIEKYIRGNFASCVYDSALLNFRHLNQIEQQAWQKVPVVETEEYVECLIRNQDDRVLFIETYFFEKNLCKKCIVKSPQGLLLSTQVMRYTFLNDSENDVTLYDSNDRLVLKKTYQADPITGEFTVQI
jgi:hypothetical protein